MSTRRLADIAFTRAGDEGDIKFVLERALGGWGPLQSASDNLGKAMGGPLLRLDVEVADDVDARHPPRPVPPEDPYAGQDWVVR
ncbi:MAG: hypothetical protein GEU74_08040 [Nitriliruptorales bacterium]|nr:hypothetical protein [Nitriliruptorales bacterium]